MADKYGLEDLAKLAMQSLSPLGMEQLPTAQCTGRFLAWDVTAQHDSPTLPLAAVDGYALRTVDLNGARSSHPARLVVSDAMGPGLAVPVLAGDPLPDGCDAVVRQEDTDGYSPTLSIFRELWPYENYIRRGSDYHGGDRLLQAGSKLDAAALCLLSGGGHNVLPVRLQPKVAVLTGAGAREESVLYLCARLEELGARCTGADGAHILLLLGGPSLPKAQRVLPPLLTEPCVCLGLSRLDGRPVLSLPAEPVALMAAVELLVRPLLAFLTGSSGLLPKSVKAPLAVPFPRSSPARRFLLGQYKDGRVLLPKRSELRAMPSCNCLVDLPAGTPSLSVGAQVRTLLI